MPHPSRARHSRLVTCALFTSFVVARSDRLLTLIVSYDLELLTLDPNPNFSRVFCCSAGSIRQGCVALGRAPRRTVKYASVSLPARALP